MKNIITLFLAAFLALPFWVSAQKIVSVSPAQWGASTKLIQQAVDSLSKVGGGMVKLHEGQYLSGGIELKNNITLHLEKGVVLLGSDKYADYNVKHDAFIYGENLSNIAITGEGTIDGVDCYNPKGEEGFRGPHCIRLIRCSNIKIVGITILRSANWAINCRYCSGGYVENVKIRGGHDGLHTRFCSDFNVKDCDFRTGDDAFAGNDNRNITVTNCKINTSCNGFRMGCMNFTVKRCQLWGPGESVHKIQKRNNMLAAFVHFSPKDENSKLQSGNWLIEDVTVENVDQFYVYNFIDGLWQTGQPVTNVQIKKVKAIGVLGAFNIIGDLDKKFQLSMENSSFSFREGANYTGGKFEGSKLLSSALFNAANFDRLLLRNVTLKKNEDAVLLNCTSGNSLVLDRVTFNTGGSSLPYKIEMIKEFKKRR